MDPGSKSPSLDEFLSAELLRWLLEGDISVRFQVTRDLLGEERQDLQDRIATEGWGAMILSLRQNYGHWGKSYYQPKWTSTHYTLLDLRNLCISRTSEPVCRTINMVLKNEKGRDGGINPSVTIKESDVCINGMFLNFASWFGAEEKDLNSVVDFILGQKMKDGGFNCLYNRSGAVHSSLHSTLSVAEGIREYYLAGYSYRLEELLEAEARSIEFMLLHRLYLSDRTGEVIHPDFLRLFFPCRWRYDILRALDYLRYSRTPFDSRMGPALRQILEKRGGDGTWRCSRHPGQIHFDMEKGGRPSRWNTLRAIRVLGFYPPGA